MLRQVFEQIKGDLADGRPKTSTARDWRKERDEQLAINSQRAAAARAYFDKINQQTILTKAAQLAAKQRSPMY